MENELVPFSCESARRLRPWPTCRVRGTHSPLNAFDSIAGLPGSLVSGHLELELES